jgi:hypothetical protein
MNPTIIFNFFPLLQGKTLQRYKSLDNIKVLPTDSILFHSIDYILKKRETKEGHFVNVLFKGIRFIIKV